jgi:Holliday junction resolvasome RuvABC DNA-binding subunit
VASKIVLELKGKLKFVEKTTVFSQALNALCSLGLSRGEAIQRLKELPKNLSLEEMVKQALRK